MHCELESSASTAAAEATAAAKATETATATAATETATGMAATEAATAETTAEVRPIAAIVGGWEEGTSIMAAAASFPVFV